MLRKSYSIIDTQYKLKQCNRNVINDAMQKQNDELPIKRLVVFSKKAQNSSLSRESFFHCVVTIVK